MTIKEKLSQIKTTIEEIKNITEKLGNDKALKLKIEEMTNEISRLKKGAQGAPFLCSLQILRYALFRDALIFP